jgi:hypothetical protein
VQQIPSASRGTVPVVTEVPIWFPSQMSSPNSNHATASKFNLRGLPLELRADIFRQDLLEWTNDRLIPNLIKALRADPQMYQEALDIFYCLKHYLIGAQSEREVLSMPQSVLKRVLSVEL